MKLLKPPLVAAAVTTILLACGAHAQTPPAGPQAIYVAEFEVKDMEGIKPYSAQVESTFSPFGGHFIVRGGRLVSQEGPVTKRIVMIEFPSFEKAQAWYDSPGYTELRKIRHQTATSKVFTVEEVAR